MDDTVRVADGARRRRLGKRIAVASAVVIAFATLTPLANNGSVNPLCIVCGNVGGVDVVLNVLLFLPLGVGLALGGVRASRAMLLSCAFTVLIETLQFSVVRGRDASLGDVLMNSLGGALGYLVAARLYVILYPRRGGARALAIAWAALWLMFQILASATLVPVWPDTEYFGQIARPLRREGTFTGRVLDATVAGVSIGDRAVPAARAIRAAARSDDGVQVRVRVLAPGITGEFAPIFRLVDDRERELVVLAQDGADLVFGVYAGADVLKLRRWRFRLSHAFTGAPPRRAAEDTMLLEARYSRSLVSLRAGGLLMRVSPRPADSWRLIWPVSTYFTSFAFRYVLAAVWGALLALPGFYWCCRYTFLQPGPWRQRVPTIALLALAFAGAVAIAIPREFSIESSPIVDVTGVVAGFAAGLTLAWYGRRRG